ncbi:MAG: putative beta-xylosidase [Pedosphaera sp.]|nr:putative beta-xylosidase [Pedosphaera sp.]
MEPRYRLKLFLALALWLVLQPLGVSGGMGAPALCFSNPIVQPGADPFVAWYDGFYYFTCTEGAGKNQINIRQARSLAGLQSATPAVIWHAPDFGPDCRDIWAPELHLLQGHWYVYFAGTSTNEPDINRRMFVLESRDADPMGPYTEKARLGIPGDDHYAIDGTVLQQPDGSLYFIWSGRAVEQVGPQNLYIARMSNPWTLTGSRVKISSPEFDWEKKGWSVNEGPAVLQHNQAVFVTYSASGGTTPDYCLGLLANTNGDLLNPRAWRKSPQPVFASYSGDDGKVFTVGHNSFFKSPDGREDWIIYHGKENQDGTWKGRSARAQKFFWSTKGEPVFGHPVPAGIFIALPSGEPVMGLPNLGVPQNLNLNTNKSNRILTNQFIESP